MDYMEINNTKKRGRPATGRAKDGCLFIRLPLKDKEWIKKEVEGLLGRRGPEVMPKLTPLQVNEMNEFGLSERKGVDLLKNRIKELEDRLKVYEGY